ncbi:MAG: hypothetical protein E7099_03405 [Mediterranea massiliensis]|nr:hypothetical protein [Mediterranea massiliensis]
MNRIIKKVGIVATVFMFVACSFHSYQPQLTQITVSKFRKPDSLAILNEDTSIAAILWRDYYKDKHLCTLIDTALSHNLTLYNSLLQMEKSASYYGKTAAQFWPSIALQISQEQVKRSYPDYSFNAHSVGISLSNWEIDLWGKLRSSRRAGLAQLLKQESLIQGVKVKLVADIATLYYRLIGLDTKLKAVNEIITSNQEYLSEQEKLMALSSHRENKSRSKNDLMLADVTRTNIAVEQAKAELYRAKATKPDIESEIFITENALNLLLSRPNGVIPRSEIETMLTPQLLDDTVSIGVPAQLLQYRPDVMAAEYAVREAFHLMDAARSSLYPSLTLRANLATGEDNNASWSDFSGSVFYNLFSGLTFPIFRQGELRHNKRVREIESKQKLADYQQTLFSACIEVSNTLMYYQMNHSKVVNLARRYASLRNAYLYSRDLYRKHKANYLDVLAAQSQLLQTRIDLSDAFIAYYSHRIALYKALGGGAWQ